MRGVVSCLDFVASAEEAIRWTEGKHKSFGKKVQEKKFSLSFFGVTSCVLNVVSRIECVFLLDALISRLNCLALSYP